MGSALERGKLFLQGVAGGVAAAAVLVAAAQAADAVLGLGGPEMQRRHHGPAAGFELLSGMDGTGVEALVFRGGHDAPLRVAQISC